MTEINSREWPVEDREAVSACPVCGSNHRYLLYDGLTDLIFFCAPGQWQLYKCSECGSAYLDPRPTPETIGRAYANYYTHDQESSKAKSPFRRLRRAVVNGYRNRKYGTKEFPALSWGYWLAHMLPGQRATVDALMRHLPLSKAGNRLLDIGCGNGDFLARAKNAGWEVQGVETDRKAVEVARKRGVVVHLDLPDALKGQYGSFDGITLSHVIEHIHDPQGLLRECHKLLKPGGWLWVETPNIDSLGSRRFGKNWRGLEPPRHLVLFTRSSLLRSFKAAGFRNFVDMPYREQYCNINAACEAIRQGLDPTNCRPTLLQRLKCVIPSFRARYDLEAREFVTVRAEKK